MEFTDWSDLRQFDENYSHKPDSNNDGNQNKEQSKGNEKNEAQGSGEQQGDASSFEVTDWNDLRKFDDDHDDDWFKYQEKLMTEQYGGNFIKVKYSSNGRVAYFCELCLAECNAKKSLELHCAGMKHLKKKDLWEKDGKPQPPIMAFSGENGQPKGPSGESSKDRRTRSPQPPRGRKGRSGIGYNKDTPRDSGYPYDRSREPHGYGSSYSRDGIPSLLEYDRYYERDRFHDEHDHRDRDHNRYGSPPPGGYGPPAPHLGRSDSMGRSSSLSRYSPKRVKDFSLITRKDYDHGREKRYPDYDDRRPSPRPRYYGDRDKRSRSPERKKSYSSRRDRSRSPRRNSVTPPPPPKISSSRRSSETEKKVNLASSPAGSLLQKLAECCVKSSEDSDLALNVVAALTKSLKEYCQRNEETKLADLLMEAELKVGTVKALKAGMKMLSNFTSDSVSSSISSGKVHSMYHAMNPPPNSQQPAPPPHAPVQYPSGISLGRYNY